MDLRPSPDLDLLRRTVREFAEAEIRPHVEAWDEAQAFSTDLVPKLAALGLMGIQVPEVYGGAAMSALEYCVCIEELARVDPSIALSVAAHNGLCVAHLYLFGSEAQKQRYLVPLAQGEVIGAWGLTEASAGSDAGAMKTTARREGAEWILSGTKQFITHGRIGGTIVAMAVTDRAKGRHGVTAFVIPRGTPGFAAGKKENKLGMRASDTSEVIFDNCRVPADAVVGEEGQGFVNTLQVLDAGRIGIAALAVGLAQGAFEAARNYARDRRQFGRPISEFQAIRWKLADMATRIEAARLLTYRAAWLRDQKVERTSQASSIAKLYTSEIAVRAAEECVQIHGGYGFVKDYPAEKFFRDVKLCTIGEGTSEIQRLVIARQILGGEMPGESTLIDRLFARDPRAVARAISLIEDDDPVAPALVARLQSARGQVHVIGVTGPPGAGKSTLVDRLIAAYRGDGTRVGVLAVDPSSVFTGGAILGDRVRMQAHFEDAGVFIRSMATRGHLGGLARATRHAILVLAAAGFDVVIIETVGVGQDEIEIVRTADVSIVTLVPGAGDEVQALKAGIMEIADIFVINKADREGADRTAAHVEAMLSLEHAEGGTWRPPVLRAVATTGEGVAEIVAAIAAFRGSDAAKRSTLARAASARRVAELGGHAKVGPSAEAAGMIASAAKVDHLGIAVADSAPYAELFATVFGLETSAPEDVGLHRLRFVQTGDTTLELVEPLSPEAPIAKYLAGRGPGLHHLCLRVADIDKAIAAVRERGVRMIDDVPRQGAHGSRIAFIHPSSTLGLLIELKEPAR